MRINGGMLYSLAKRIRNAVLLRWKRNNEDT